MKKFIPLCFVAAFACGLSSAATLTLTNADFQANLSGNPNSWTAFETSGDTIYMWGNATGGLASGAGVLAFKASPNVDYVQQSFLTSEVTANTYGSFSVSFEAGWRNNTVAPNDLGWTVSIWNVTDNVALGSATYTLPSLTNAYNTYRSYGVQTLNINYDNTVGSLAGDEIAVRFESNSTQNDIDPTGWIDNITVTAVPEPSTYGLMGAGSLAAVALLRRRRRS